MVVMKTEYLQGEQEVNDFLNNGHCEYCLRPAYKWTKPNKYGHLELHGLYANNGNLIGFLCPICAKINELKNYWEE